MSLSISEAFERSAEDCRDFLSVNPQLLREVLQELLLVEEDATARTKETRKQSAPLMTLRQRRVYASSSPVKAFYWRYSDTSEGVGGVLTMPIRSDLRTLCYHPVDKVWRQRQKRRPLRKASEEKQLDRRAQGEQRCTESSGVRNGLPQRTLHCYSKTKRVCRCQD
ncbi:hypothetical protein cyc_02902 [Cyclospora cayetanensis]|uniref:Uncharacterized protein n=1 Tax=Cyclospora cayetanensis TaxID=88456 RepID=A0A1D3CYH3_9EIME|nr:hypothetical protein cyc_02902 [Cyclospora cayetanensis]